MRAGGGMARGAGALCCEERWAGSSSERRLKGLLSQRGREWMVVANGRWCGFCTGRLPPNCSKMNGRFPLLVPCHSNNGWATSRNTRERPAG